MTKNQQNLLGFLGLLALMLVWLAFEKNNTQPQKISVTVATVERQCVNTCFQLVHFSATKRNRIEHDERRVYVWKEPWVKVGDSILVEEKPRALLPKMRHRHYGYRYIGLDQ